MVTIKDGCGCDPCDCDWKQKLKEAYSRATQSVNKIGDNDGSVYFPDGTGFVKLPLPRQSDVAQIHTNTEDISNLKARDIQLQANITTEETARKAKDELLDADITRIDATDTAQNERIQDNADRITAVNNDLISTESTVATHDSEIITLQAQTQALSKSLVSDVLMTDGTTAGSVQVSIERKDGTLITSANYRWGKDIGIRLEAGTQEGYVKAVISLSDGTELVSNEYKIVEVLESDVYVTAVTLIADQAAGTLGGNISYSNGTTQTINSVSVPTAPGVTSAIEALQGRMTAVEQKNTTQDSQISAIDARVKAIEDTPGVGQFAAGKLGTIAGSTTDGRIKAEDDGTGSVNGWSDLKGKVTTAEANIVSVQGDVSDLNGRVGTHDTEINGIMTDITAIETKNTQQDTAINGKISIAQGSANAGKALVVGSDGNVAPGEVSGGEVWEEVNLSNIPTDFVNGDRIKFQPKWVNIGSTPTSWTSVPGKPKIITQTGVADSKAIIEVILETNDAGGQSAVASNFTSSFTSSYIGAYRWKINSVSKWNSANLMTLCADVWNGAGCASVEVNITSSNISKYIVKMWRLKQ